MHTFTHTFAYTHTHVSTNPIDPPSTYLFLYDVAWPLVTFFVVYSYNLSSHTHTFISLLLCINKSYLLNNLFVHAIALPKAAKKGPMGYLGLLKVIFLVVRCIYVNHYILQFLLLISFFIHTILTLYYVSLILLAIDIHLTY